MDMSQAADQSESVICLQHVMSMRALPITLNVALALFFWVDVVSVVEGAARVFRQTG
jgi:hypothetical protein